MDTIQSETIGLLGNTLKLAQIKGGFYSSMDSVMVAAACPAKTEQRVLDLGCGVGGAGLALAHRVQGIDLTGVEIQADHATLAAQNAKTNDIQADFITRDIRDYSPEQCFDHIICNPPYMEAGAHLRSPSEAKAKAMGHDEATLQEWVDCAYRNLKSRGSLTMIHQASAVDRIIQAIGKRFGAIEIIPLWPRAGVDAKRVIVRAYKDRKSPAHIRAGLVLHEENGEYTPQAQNILRDGHALL